MWNWFRPAVAILFLAITCFDIASRLEHWPFGSYPMYSLLHGDRLTKLQLYGVTAKGEVPMRADHDFPPFDQARLISSLERLPPARLQTALDNLMKLHPGLQSLRLYRVSWNLRPGLNGSQPPASRTILAAADKPL